MRKFLALTLATLVSSATALTQGGRIRLSVVGIRCMQQTVEDILLLEGQFQ